MIKKITYKGTVDCFLEKQSFEFKQLTLLVGDQGIGKSTMLEHLISYSKNEGDLDHFKVEDHDKFENFVFFDSERMNPRTNKNNFKPGSLHALTVDLKSHGEIVFPILKELTNHKNTLILIDEPEVSLSLRSQFEFIDRINEALRNGCQIILATHNYLFMKEFPDSILSIEHGEYISLQKFVNRQKKKSNYIAERDDKIIKLTKCKMGESCTCANETGWYNNKCDNYLMRRGGF